MKRGRNWWAITGKYAAVGVLLLATVVQPLAGVGTAQVGAQAAQDTSGPTITVQSPGVQTVFSTSVPVTVSAYDPSELSAVCIKFDGGSCVSGGYIYRPQNNAAVSVVIDTSAASQGEHIVGIRAVDRLGNATEQSVPIVVDTKQPVITPLIADGTVLSGTRTIAMQLDEAHPKVANIRVLHPDGSPVMVDGKVLGVYSAEATETLFNYEFTTSQVVDGEYKLQFSARDALGHGAITVMRTVYVDNSAPSFSVQQPVIVGSSVTVSGSSEPGAVVTVAVAGLTHQAVADTSGVWTLTVSGVVPGAYTATLQARDQSGNQSASSTLSFTIPSVSTPVDEPEVGVPVENGEFTNAPGTSVVTETLALVEPLPTSYNLAQSTPDAPAVARTAEVSTARTEQAPLEETNGEVMSAQTIRQSAAQTASGTASIQATSGGWQIFGLLWYWWAVIGLLAVGLLWFFWPRLRRLVGAR